VRALAAAGRAAGALRAHRDGLRRRLPALPGGGGRERLDQGGQPDHADDPARATPQAQAPAGIALRAPSGARAAGRLGTILRRLSEHELAIVEAADLFNASAFRRTIAGIAKSLGGPKASVVPLSGVNSEVAITVAWDLSWYQYRVTLDSAQPVRLEERGHELGELENTFKEWNAHLEDDGRLVPQIARL